MQLPYAAVLFDLDGTLIDSRQDIASAVNRTLSRHGFAERSYDDLIGFIGDGATELLARAVNLDTGTREVAALLETFREDYRQNALVETVLLPGAKETLAHLSALIPLALCTNKPRSSTLPILSGLGIDGAFRCVVAGDDLPERKPSPAPLLSALKRLGAEPARALMVGDGPQDILAARAAGVPSVAILGIADQRELDRALPDRTISALTDLIPIVTGSR